MSKTWISSKLTRNLLNQIRVYAVKHHRYFKVKSQPTNWNWIFSKMLKHYYVSPKKRTKSQSSEASAASENSTDGPPAGVGTDGHRRQHSGAASKTGAYSFRRSPHSLRNAYPLFIDDFDDWRTKGAAAASALQQQQHHHLLQHCKTTDNMDQKRPPSGHKMQFLQFCKNYKTSNYAEHRGGHSNVSTGYTSDSSLSASVRRWNSFHSTRGECHPNKFRRERKSTSPSLEFERQRYQASSTTSTPSRSRQLRRGKSLATPEKLSSLSCSGGIGPGSSSNHSLILGAYFSAAAAEHRNVCHANTLGSASSDDTVLFKSGHTSLW